MSLIQFKLGGKKKGSIGENEECCLLYQNHACACRVQEGGEKFRKLNGVSDMKEKE